MILPDSIPFTSWWANLINDFPLASDAIPRLDAEANWREAVDRLCGIPTFSIKNVPYNGAFSTPQDWACAFTKLMY